MIHKNISEIDYLTVETGCQNPGKSIPSPFDSCNICRCSSEGVIEGCTRQLCEQEGNFITYLLRFLDCNINISGLNF